MAITYFTQSKKEIAPIWVRYTDAYSDAKTRTPLYINKDRLQRGKIIKHKTNRALPTNKRNEIRDRNNALESLEVSMGDLTNLILDAVNELPQRTVIKSEWLKMIVNQTNNVNLKGHIKNWVDSKSPLAENTINSVKVFQNFMEENFDTDIFLSSIDIKYFDRFKSSLRKNYSARTMNLYASYLVAVCRYAEDRGNKLNFDKSKIGKEKQSKAIKSYLTFDDLQKIIEVDFKDQVKVSKEKLEASRDWLVISCYTGMRASDIYNLTNLNIKKNNIVYKQKKTDSNDVYAPILEPVEAILKKYGGFPPKNNKQEKATWGQRYQRHIKKVCELAGIDDMVDKKIGNKVVKTEKYNTITTHIGRMSFATNFYGKLPTTDIMSITGHSSEAQLLTYINKNRVRTDNTLKDRMNDIIMKSKN
jgi:integrase